MVLICHENDPVDCEGIASWMDCSFALAGIVLLREKPGSLFRKLQREYRRVGLCRLLDVALFRLVYFFRHAKVDARWVKNKVSELRQRYPANLGAVPRLYAHDANADAVGEFIAGLQPEFVLARCKYILKPEIFRIPRFGTYALHPGICPVYRNAHGCFWALVSRDLGNVGMTLLKVDTGIDTGPVYLQSSYDYDETTESHVVIQHRVVLENLEAIAKVLYDIRDRTASPKRIPPTQSINWGQPWLTAYMHWQRSARRAVA